jgi:hypothetical protein
MNKILHKINVLENQLTTEEIIEFRKTLSSQRTWNRLDVLCFKFLSFLGCTLGLISIYMVL